MGLVTLELSNASKPVTFALICARIKHKKKADSKNILVIVVLEKQHILVS